MKSKTAYSVANTVRDGQITVESDQFDAERFKAFWAKYSAVEEAIVTARERRRANARANRRARARQFADLYELSEGQSARWKRDGFFEGEEFWLALFRDPGYFAYIDFMRRKSSQKVAKVKASVRRPHYYAAENERRRRLADERRRIKSRRTVNGCPTKEQILDAWIARRRSHEDAMRFGSLLEDLECYIDNDLRRSEDGVILGRNPGIKGWLKENLPALALQYTSVMRYKAAAKKMKQITELRDPTALDAILPERQKEELSAKTGGAVAERREETPAVEIVRSRAIYCEVVRSAGSSTAALFRRIDELLDPELVEAANMLAEWREKYQNEITVRTKKRWWRRIRWVQNAEEKIQVSAVD
jgi:hypothetical protein